jgi:hypothetical protein
LRRKQRFPLLVCTLNLLVLPMTLTFVKGVMPCYA